MFTAREVVRRHLLPRRLGFIPRAAIVRYVVDRVALEQGVFRVIRFSHVGITPPMRHTHSRMHVAVTRRTNGRTLF